MLKSISNVKPVPTCVSTGTAAIFVNGDGKYVISPCVTSDIVFTGPVKFAVAVAPAPPPPVKPTVGTLKYSPFVNT